MKPISIGKATLLFAALTLVWVGSHAWSQTHRSTTEELARESDLVAVGKVKELRSEWTAGQKAIVTRVTLGLEEVLKGNSGQSVTLVVPGGEVDGVGEWYSHTPRFKKEEEIVVFAKRQGTSAFRVARGEEGRLLITKDPRTGNRHVAGGMTLDEVKKRVKNTR